MHTIHLVKCGYDKNNYLYCSWILVYFCIKTYNYNYERWKCFVPSKDICPCFVHEGFMNCEFYYRCLMGNINVHMQMYRVVPQTKGRNWTTNKQAIRFQPWGFQYDILHICLSWITRLCIYVLYTLGAILILTFTQKQSIHHLYRFWDT